jgi:hypothetical protein
MASSAPNVTYQTIAAYFSINTNQHTGTHFKSWSSHVYTLSLIVAVRHRLWWNAHHFFDVGKCDTGWRSQWSFSLQFWHSVWLPCDLGEFSFQVDYFSHQIIKIIYFKTQLISIFVHWSVSNNAHCHANQDKLGFLKIFHVGETPSDYVLQGQKYAQSFRELFPGEIWWKSLDFNICRECNNGWTMSLMFTNTLYSMKIPNGNC